MVKTQRNIGYDIIRIVAMFMVIGIHSNSIPIRETLGTPVWYVIMAIQVVYIISVPLFFMVSGALLVNTEEPISVKELYKNRIPKQAVPFFVWSLVYVTARIVMGKIPFALSSFTSIIHSPAYYQFWFMYTLLAIYLLLPLLHTLLVNCDKKKTEYLLGLWFIFSIIIPLATRYVPGFAISDHTDLVINCGYIGYFILGYYLNTYKQDVKVSAGVVMWVSGTVITFVCSVVEYVYSKNNGMNFQGFVYQEYMMPAVVMAACGAFIVFGNKEWRFRGKTAEKITRLSVLSMGMYYIHMLVLTALEATNLIDPTKLSMLFVKLFVTWLVSLVSVYIISLIPGVRRVLLGVK